MNAGKHILTLLLLLPYACSGPSGKEGPVGLLLSPAHAAPPPTGPVMDREKVQMGISRFIDSCYRKQFINGGVLVAYRGDVLFEQYGGFGHYRHGRDTIKPSSAFHVASVSKTITAMATLKLCEEGKLKLGDDLTTFFPAFPRKGITVRSLLNHRSGLPNYVHFMERLGWNKKRKVTNADILDFLTRRHKEIAIARPDTRFNYSNTNYALLALVIEKVTGKPFQRYISESIFLPLGMKDSYIFTRADSLRSLPSYFYSGRQYAFDYLDLVYGDKNVYSTPRDLLKFDRALSTHALLSGASLDSAYQPYSFERPGQNNYGLGWRMYLLKNGKKIIYHNGWWHGNRASFMRLLDEEVAIIAVCNNDSKQVYSVRKMADLFGNYFNGDPSGAEEENSSVRQEPRKFPHRNNTAHRPRRKSGAPVAYGHARNSRK